MEARDYQNAFDSRLPRRTAINRLNRLREAGWIERFGQTRATIYRLAEAGRQRLGVPMKRGCSYVGIDSGWDDPGASRVAEEAPGGGLESGRSGDLSGEAGELRRLLQRPVAKRPPVGYRREFLESYRPNETFYLDEALREKLREIGEQPGPIPESAQTYAREVCGRLLIDLSWNSSRLEGNTYSLLETEQLLFAGRSRDGEMSGEAVMILNHKAAIEFLLENKNEAGFDRRTILNLHTLLTADLLRDPEDEGRLRTTPVRIGRSSYLPTDIPDVIAHSFETILAKAGAIGDPFEQAFFAMVHIPYLQPFIDGNKRVSRLAANLPLFRRGLAPLSFLEVSKEQYTDAMLAVYELNETSLLGEVFAQAYERSASRYTAIRGKIGVPDLFRVKYRRAIAERVAEVVRGRLGRSEAAALLRRRAEATMNEADRARFTATVEEALSGLHEGNFARYQLRPAEFDAWKAVWDGDLAPVPPEATELQKDDPQV